MKKIIKLTEGQLKRMVQDTINEQSASNYFDVYEKADGVKLKSTSDPNCKMDDSSPRHIYYIFNNGTCLLQRTSDKFKGKMNILSDKSYNIVFENGQKYDSATNKYISTSTDTPKINTVNCANQLIDTSKGKILKFGCKTQGVKELQTILSVFGKDGVPTGYFGSRTKQAVIDFQTKNQLAKKEGIVGPETYKALTPNAVPPSAQDVKEYDDNYDDEDYNELDSLFTNNFNTEDDYDGETLRGDESGFSNNMRQKQINKSIKLGDSNIGSGRYLTKDRKKDRENEKRGYVGLDLLRNDSQPKPYSPIKSDDLPLDKYLEKKKMKNLDEDEDIAMLDNLLKKD